jgi:hypothetical protein
MNRPLRREYDTLSVSYWHEQNSELVCCACVRTVFYSWVVLDCAAVLFTVGTSGGGGGLTDCILRRGRESRAEQG